MQMVYRLQSMHNHMVGRAASVVSPFYFILLGYGAKIVRVVPLRIMQPFISYSLTLSYCPVWTTQCVESTRYILCYKCSLARAQWCTYNILFPHHPSWNWIIFLSRIQCSSLFENIRNLLSFYCNSLKFMTPPAHLKESNLFSIFNYSTKY